MDIDEVSALLDMSDSNEAPGKKKKKPTAKKKKGNGMENSHWSHNEILALIPLWSNFNEQLNKMTNHTYVYDKISASLKLEGVTRSSQQVKDKIKNMKADYRKTRDELPTTGGGGDDAGNKKWPYFDAVKQIVCGESFNNPDLYTSEESALASGENPELKRQKIELPSKEVVAKKKKRGLSDINSKLDEIIDLTKKSDLAINTHLDFMKERTIKQDEQSDILFKAMMSRLMNPMPNLIQPDPALDQNAYSGMQVYNHPPHYQYPN